MDKLLEHIFGLSDDLIIQTKDQVALHQDIQSEWETLCSLAAESSLQLKAISTYRNFDSQKRIWNLKASGQRTLLDSESNPLPFEKLNKEEICLAILRWSAFPGLSRHHWGTEFDVYDQRALDLKPGYQIELIPSEYQKEGIFESLGSWLASDHFKESSFYRPYAKDRGGVAPEPWHISYAPLANEFQSTLKIDEAIRFINSELCDDILHIDWIRDHSDYILKQFVYNISPSPSSSGSDPSSESV